MSKKQDSYYFQNFIACAGLSCQAAQLLKQAFGDFQPDKLTERMDQIHAVEHEADRKKHDLLNTLVKAFITPIEREDILLLSQNIDEVTDKIEDVFLRLYCNNIQSIRPDALEMVGVAIRCCEELKTLLKEFSDFRRSKTLHTHIVNINTLEEEADRLFISGMRHLHTSCRDPLTVISWREIYIYLEKCVDACEHAADTVESVVMKNS